jgi:hypothetical protein
LALGCEPAAAPSRAEAAPAIAAVRAPTPLDGVDPQAIAWLHVDVARTRETAAFGDFFALVKHFLAKKGFEQVNAECGFPVIDSIKGFLLNYRGDDTTLVLTTTAPPQGLLPCVRAVTRGTDARLEDGTPVVRISDARYVALVRDGALFLGPKQAIERIRPKDPDAAGIASRLAIHGNVLVSGYAGPASGQFRREVIGAYGTIAADPETAQLDLTLDTNTEADARTISDELQQNDSSSAEEAACGCRLEREVRVEGKTVHYRRQAPNNEGTSKLVTAILMHMVSGRDARAASKGDAAPDEVNTPDAGR